MSPVSAISTVPMGVTTLVQVKGLSKNHHSKVYLLVLLAPVLQIIHHTNSETKILNICG